MSPATPEYWVTLGAVLWKICTGFVFPCIAIYGSVAIIVWLIKKGGMSDL